VKSTAYKELNNVKEQESAYLGWLWRVSNTWWRSQSTARKKKSK